MSAMSESSSLLRRESSTARFAAGWEFETAKLFLVASNPLGQRFDGSAQMTDLRRKAGHRPRVMAARPVLLDHSAQGLVPVEAGAADAGCGGDRGEGDGLTVFAEEFGARSLDLGQGLGMMSSRCLLSQEGVEAGDEAAMAVGLVDPAPGLGVGRQRFGVDPLSREHRDAGGVGAEVGAVLADVGVGTRSLGRGTQAVATGETGLDGRRVAPVAVAGDRDPSASGRQRSDAGLGQVECPFVLGAHRGVEEPPVAKAHLRRDVAEEGHERLERHPGIHHGGGEGVPELVRGHVADAGRLCGPVELGAQSLLAEPSPVVGEEELARPSVRGCGSGRPSDRVATIRSIRATVSSSSGTIRSVSSLPRGP